MGKSLPKRSFSRVRGGVAHRLFRVQFLVLIVAIVAFDSARAIASCGDYLFRNGRPVSGHSMPLSQSIDDATLDVRGFSMQTPDTSSPMELPLRPCRGPNCSGTPFPAFPLSVVLINLHSGLQSGLLAETLQRLSDGQQPHEIPRSERGACWMPTTIFRPPAAA